MDGAKWTLGCYGMITVKSNIVTKLRFLVISLTVWGRVLNKYGSHHQYVEIIKLAAKPFENTFTSK